MTPMTHHTNGPGAEYLIAQHVEDPFRREARNVGVFVRKEGRYAARFVGETGPGVLDGRLVEVLAAPDVYRQWVQYWRGVLDDEPDPFAALQQHSSAHYLVVDGGTVLDTGDDPPEVVAAFLYARLVTERSFARA